MAEEARLLIFKLEDEVYGVEVQQLREIIRLSHITSIPTAPPFIKGLINLRGKLVVVTDLKEKFNLKKEKEGTHIVIAEVGEHTFGVIVDEVLEVMRIPREEIKEPPKLVTEKLREKFLKGVIIRGEEIIIVLDISRIYSEEEMEKLSEVSV